MDEPRYGAPGNGVETEQAVRDIEAQQVPAAPDAPSAPPLREDYGGPRESSDGTRVSPDTTDPGTPPAASARRGQPAASGGATEDEGREGEEPPAIPPTEPQPAPVKDPPAEPTPPYVVTQPTGPSTFETPASRPGGAR